jgi:hypothetical protein
VTVLALDALVRRTPVRPDVVCVAFHAGVAPLVLDWELLPFLDVGLPIEVVGKAIPVNPEVIRDQEHSQYENQSYQTDGYPQRM